MNCCGSEQGNHLPSCENAPCPICGAGPLDLCCTMMECDND